MTALIYLAGIVLLLRLFDLQIVQGEEYREKSNTRLTRETTLEAARGSFLDRTGTVIASTTTAAKVELYKTKIDNQTLNNAILEMLNVLEKNGDKYKDTLPITINPFAYNFSSEERLADFKEDYKIPENASAEEAFEILKKKYEIQNESVEEARKIMIVRYAISENGYSATKPIEVAENISNQSINELGERGAEFPGVSIVTEPIRNYSQLSLASHILGYVGKISETEYEERKDEGYSNNDYIGKSGLEYVLEEYLRGKNGVRQIDMDVNGTTTGEYIAEEAVAGADVVLTIDANLQKVTEDRLKETIEKIKNGGFGTSYEAKGGAAVVMNVNNGEVLALASVPDFEPQLLTNGISQAKWDEYQEGNALFNRAVQGAYAPGSIFKMVTAMAGLETGAITRTERINDTGIYPHGHNPRCWVYNDYGYGHGWVNVSQALQKSCNYFFYEVGYRMGIEELEKYASYFGLGRKTGIELPGEVSGTVAGQTNSSKYNRTWYLGDTLNAVIGQSDNNFSPIQMARYISILTNGQKTVQPTLIKNIIRADGTYVQADEINQFVNEKLGLTEETEEELNFDPENVKVVLEGMRATTELGGTAYSIFRNFDIEVGGKTGSTESNTGDINAWFVGFAPYDNPEIAVVILIENGGHGYYAAEVVRDIIAEYYGISARAYTEDMSAQTDARQIR